LAVAVGSFQRERFLTGNRTYRTESRPYHSNILNCVIKTLRIIGKAQLALTLSLCFFTTEFATAQEKEVIRGHQVWLQYYGQARVSEKWTWQFDGGFRWRDVFVQSSSHILRTSLGYSLGSNVRVSAGLAHLGLYSQEKLLRVEFRPYQDLQLTQALGKLGLSHRFRLEERIFYPVEEGRIQNTDHFNFRFRYAAMLGIPLFKLSRDHPEAAFILFVGDEIFLNFGPEITHNYFDQNRLTLSPTFKFNEALSISLTWNNQFASTPVASVYTHTQVFWVQVRHQMDFRKGKPAN